MSDWVAVLNWGSDFDRLYLYDENGDAIAGESEADPYMAAMMFDDADTGEWTFRYS